MRPGRINKRLIIYFKTFNGDVRNLRWYSFTKDGKEAERQTRTKAGEGKRACCVGRRLDL